jgi:cysteine desulfurase
MIRLRDRFEAAVGNGPTVFGRFVPRLPNTILVGLAGLRAETAVIALDLDGIAASSGSACSSGKVTPSHVLAAMRVAPDLAQGALRFSLGWSTTESDIDRAIAAWTKLAGSPHRKTASGAA